MNRLDEIRENISNCDDLIIEQLVVRMNYIKDIIAFKKDAEIPILQPEQEKKQRLTLMSKLENHEFEDEILDIFSNVTKNSRKIQSKSLFNYNVFLVGFMGAGKTTIAEGLGELLEMERIEMDHLISEKQGMSIPDIFEQYGEIYFRNLESNALIEMQKKSQAVISCGGGVVMRPDNADHMKKHGRVVLLTAEPETIYFRVKDSDERPILNNNMNVDYIGELMDKRWEKYQTVADIIVQTDHRDVVDICQEIISKLIALDKADAEALAGK